MEFIEEQVSETLSFHDFFLRAYGTNPFEWFRSPIGSESAGSRVAGSTIRE